MPPIRTTTAYSAEFICGDRKESSDIAPKTLGGYSIIQVYEDRSLSLLKQAEVDNLPVDVTIYATTNGVGQNRSATRNSRKECFTANVVGCNPHGLVEFG